MTTRAALFVEPSCPLRVRTIALDPPGPYDVRVRMSAVGVCGSDLHVVRGEWTRPVPMVLGHEGAGVIEAVGSAVQDVRVGDRVIIHWAPACDDCDACRRGRPATCARLRAAIAAGTLVDGTTRMTHEGRPVYRMTSVGAFAEQIVVPARSVIPVPDNISMREAALVGCAALTGVGVVTNVAEVGPEDRTLVIGAGGVGQFVVQALRVAGADVVAVSDPASQRRELARRYGATHTVGVGELEHLVEDLGGEGFDTVFEAVGSPQTVRAAMAVTRIGGLTALVGMAPTGTEVEFDPFTFTAQERRLAGSMYGSADPRVTSATVLELAERGELELASMLGPSFDLDHINDGIEAALSGTEGRVTITPNGTTD